MERIITPLKKINGTFSPTSFNEAYQTIFQNIKTAKPEENAVFAGGKLSNEELYLLQKLARIGIKTNALSSFEYLERQGAFCFDKNDIVPVVELPGTTRCYAIGYTKENQNPQLQLVTAITTANLIPTYYFEEETQISDYHTFFQAVNYYIVTHERYRGIFIEGLAKNIPEYLQSLKSYNWTNLLENSNVTEDFVAEFVDGLLKEDCPVIIYYEPETSLDTIKELNNLSLLVGIQAQASSGLLGIKENLNTQGLFDMGFFSHLNVGGEQFDKENIEIAAQVYGSEPAHYDIDVLQNIKENKFKNYLIFQDFPSIEFENKELITNILANSFVVVQTNEFNELAKLADIILPATLPNEGEGTYTDSTRMAFKINQSENCPVEKNNFQQINEIGEMFGIPKSENVVDAFLEYVSFFKGGCRSGQRHYFKF